MEISKRTEKELQIIYMWHWYHNLFTKKEEIDPQRRKKQANKKVRFDPNCYHCEMCKYQQIIKNIWKCIITRMSINNVTRDYKHIGRVFINN